MANEPVVVWLESKLNKEFFIVLINEDLSQTNICTVDSKAQAKALVKQFNEDLKGG